MQHGEASPGRGLHSGVSSAPCPVPGRASGVLGCVDGQRERGTASGRVTQMCAGVLSCAWHPQIAPSPRAGEHILQHPAARGSGPRWDGDGK